MPIKTKITEKTTADDDYTIDNLAGGGSVVAVAAANSSPFSAQCH